MWHFVAPELMLLRGTVADKHAISAGLDAHVLGGLPNVFKKSRMRQFALFSREEAYDTK